MFIEIMKCQIFNCRLRQTTVFIPASTSKNSAVCIVTIVINATVQNTRMLQDRIMKYVAISTL